MRKTDDLFFEFITQPERFKVAAELADKLELVRTDLWNDFMADVCKRLHERVPPGWNAWPRSDINFHADDRGHVGIYNESYVVEGHEDAIFWITFYEDDNTFGLWFNTEFEGADIDEIRKDIAQLKSYGWKKGYRLTESTGEFIVYKGCDESFADENAYYEKILPGNRTLVVEKYTSYLIDSIDQLDPFAQKWFQIIVKGNNP
jgi:hypothetical protein